MSLDPTAPAPSYSGPAATDSDKSEATLIYVLTGILAVLGALIAFLLKKDKSPFVKDHVTECLNWGITLLLANVAMIIVGIVLAMVVPALALIPSLANLALWVLGLILCVTKGMPAMKAGQTYRFPFAIRLIK